MGSETVRLPLGRGAAILTAAMEGVPQPVPEATPSPQPSPGGRGRVLVGTAGFSYPDWKGVFYPKGLPKKVAPLGFYSRYFEVCELNRTFYGPPSAEQSRKWLEEVAAERPGFVFTAKVWQAFTHDLPAPAGEVELRLFLDGMAPLVEAGKLGALLLQFPYFFVNKPENREKVARLADIFPPVAPVVLEVRDRSWMTDPSIDFMRRLELNFCNIDQPLGRRSVAPSALCTGPVAYVRLHGRNAEAWFDKKAGRDEKYDYLYDPTELAEWAGRIADVAGQARDATYVIANNHFRGKAAANAIELKALLAGGAPQPAPPSLIAAYPGLARVASPEEYEAPRPA